MDHLGILLLDKMAEFDVEVTYARCDPHRNDQIVQTRSALEATVENCKGKGSVRDAHRSCRADNPRHRYVFGSQNLSHLASVRTSTGRHADAHTER